MPRFLKISLLVLAGVVLLAVAAVAIVAATFDPNDYKPRLIEQVKLRTQRTLAIPDPIRLSIFPSLGVETGAVSLSERNSTDAFASMRSARVSLAFWPLLRQQLVVDRVTLAGLKASVTRFEDGRLSIDDLLGQPGEARAGEPAPAASGGAPLAIDVAGVAITDATLAFDDRQAGRRAELSRATLETGRLAPGVPSEVRFVGQVKASAPVVDAQVALKAQLMFDPAAQRVAMQRIDASLEGQAAGIQGLKAALGGNADVALQPLRMDLAGLSLKLEGRQKGEGGAADAQLSAQVQAPRLVIDAKSIEAQKLGLSASLKQGTRTAQAHLALPDFKGSLPTFQVPALTGDASVDDGPLQAKATLSGALQGDLDQQRFEATGFQLALDGRQGETQIRGTVALPWRADLKAGIVTLPKIDIDASLPNPGGGAMALKATGNTTLKLDPMALDGKLGGQLDQSRFTAGFGVSRFSPVAARFDVEVDQLDVDRYRSATPAAAPASGAGPGAQQPIDLSALAGLELDGQLRVGALKAAELKLAALKVGVKASGGTLRLDPLAANLYQGSMAGRASVTAAKLPRFALDEAFTGISVGPLLKDLTGKDSVEGRGNVSMNVTTQGATPDALMKALAGSANAQLRDGAVKGINIAQAVRTAKSKLGLASGGAQTGTGSSEQSTDFSELSASFRIAGGVAHNDDLDAKSPLLRVGGAGDIDIGQGRLDYLVKATVVTTLKGQGGPELDALRGQTIPVRLKGPFANIGYSIDFEGLAKEAAKQKLEEAVQTKLGVKDNAAAKDAAKKKLGEELKGLFGK